MDKEYKAVIVIGIAVIAAMLFSMTTPSAVYFIGDYYKGMEESDKAEKFFRFAAEKGYPKAQFAMAVICAERHDFKEAMKWGRPAAESGLPEAQHNMGIYCIALEGDHPDLSSVDESIKWLSMSAGQGFERSYPTLAMCYMEKADRFDKKNSEELLKKSFYWTCKSADAGNDRALAEKGQCLLLGRGVEKNAAEAFSVFESLAERGDLFGLYFKALCLFKGEGTERDIRKASETVSEAVRRASLESGVKDSDLKEKIKKLDKSIKEEIKAI